MLKLEQGLGSLLFSLLIFPSFFQWDLLYWAWGSEDALGIALLKRVFLLFPAAAIILACWTSIACLLTVIIRNQRRTYTSTLFITWWDLGRAIFSFWANNIMFVVKFFGWILGFIRLCFVATWLILQDLLLSPLRAVKGLSQMATTPGTPWIAVNLTLFWCLLEALIFTFVMTDLVVQTLSSVTSTEPPEQLVQLFLFPMLGVFVIGSYAIVASLENAIKQKDIKQIIFVAVVEFVALVFEVLFLYREFVAAIEPWLRQYAGDEFSLGLYGTLGISAMVWAGTRAMTWFLFAAHGTPPILAIIQRTGLSQSHSKVQLNAEEQFKFTKAGIELIKRDIDWNHKQAENLINAFVLAPLQILGACLNFLTLLISAKHLFELPFKSYKDALLANQLIQKVKDQS